MSVRSVVFAGGGTGGHLFPGLAIGEALRAADAETRCIFVCSDRPLDAQILSTSAAEYRPIPARPFGLSPRRLAPFLRSWGASVRSARAVLRDVRPSWVIAMGGFVAAPVVQAARCERVAVALVNLDAAPGLANRWIARHARVCFTSAEGRMPAHWRRIPPIVRAAAKANRAAAACRAAFGLDPSRRTLLVTGGSQGARSLNEFVTAFAEAEANLLRERGWQIIHQTGEQGDVAARDAYRRAGVPARVEKFVDDMASAWGAADLAVSRCGAGAVAEIWANAVPALLLPYPYHKDEHQRLNAKVLADCGGAVMARDHVEASRNMAAHREALAGLIRDDARREAMRASILGLGPADGASRVAAELMKGPFGAAGGAFPG